MKDWRTDLTEVNHLYDMDPIQVMIAYRHMYLDTAKDMLDDDSWADMGEEICMIAEQLQSAIEIQFPDQEKLRD